MEKNVGSGPKVLEIVLRKAQQVQKIEKNSLKCRTSTYQTITCNFFGIIAGVKPEAIPNQREDL